MHLFTFRLEDVTRLRTVTYLFHLVDGKIAVALPFAHEVVRVGAPSRVGSPAGATRKQTEIPVVPFEDGCRFAFLPFQHLLICAFRLQIVFTQEGDVRVGVHFGGTDMVSFPSLSTNNVWSRDSFPFGLNVL